MVNDMFHSFHWFYMVMEFTHYFTPNRVVIPSLERAFESLAYVQRWFWVKSVKINGESTFAGKQLQL